ncbi:MAG: hypothetical protein QOH65_1077, partial [Methylobacteriaceae bacterium]|nr:hypothetical protein [Methylobacteriaceae bacterium]
MLTKLLAFRFSRQPAGLFITHVLNDRVLRHFARIKSECGALIDWHLIHNTWTLTEISRRNTRCPKLLPKARLDQAIQNGSFVMGYLDVLFTPLAFETGRSF